MRQHVRYWPIIRDRVAMCARNFFPTRHYQQHVFVQPSTTADNVPLPAFAAAGRAAGLLPLLLWAHAGTDRRTPDCHIDPAACGKLFGRRQ